MRAPKPLLAMLAMVPVLWASQVYADVPWLLNFSGRLGTDAGAFTGVEDITITLYDDATSTDPANLLWTETFNLYVSGGRFHLLLGADPGNPLPVDLFANPDLFAGVRVGSEAEMTPRLRVASVPFALHAQECVSVQGSVPSDFAGSGQACTGGDKVAGINAQGEVVCAPDEGAEYTAGPGLGLVGTQIQINPIYTQRRVSSFCAPGSSLRRIHEDGTVECEVDDDSQYSGVDFAFSGQACSGTDKVAGIDSLGVLLCIPDQDTESTAGTGIALTGTEISVVPAVIEGWARGVCYDAPAELAAALPGWDQDASDDLTTATAFLGDVSGSAGNLQIATGAVLKEHLGDSGCGDGEVLKWNGSTGLWYCSNDAMGSGGDGNELVKADTLDPTPGYLSNKVDNATLEVDGLGHALRLKEGGVGSAHLQADAVTGAKVLDGSLSRQDLGDSGCSQGQVLKWDSSISAWTCGNDSGGTAYSAGNGLVLAGSELAIDPAYTQRKVSGSCPSGSSIRQVLGDGSVVCETDDSATYSGSDFALSGQTCGGTDKVAQIDATGTAVCLPDLDTTYAPGVGLALAGGTFSVEQSVVEGWARGVSYDTPAELVAALPFWDHDGSDDLTTATAFLGDVTGSAGNLRIAPGAVLKEHLGDSGCGGGQVLKWNNSTGLWACAADSTDGDELVKTDPLDPFAGYLKDKVDDATLEVDTTGHAMRVKAGGVGNTHLADATRFLSVQDGAATEQFAATNVSPSLQFVGAGATTLSFDPLNHRLTVSSTDGDTTYSAGTGLALVGTQFSVKQAVVEGWAKAVSYDTPAELAAALPGWDQDASDDLTTTTAFLGDVTGSAGNLQIAPGAVLKEDLGDSGCGGGQVLKWDNSTGLWACAADNAGSGADGNDRVKADPLDPAAGYLSDKVDGTTLEVDIPGHTMRVKAGGVGNTHLADATRFLSVQDGAATEQFAATNVSPSLQFVGAGATTLSFDPLNHRLTISSTDGDTTYSAGAGLSLVGTEFSVKQATVEGWAKAVSYDTPAELVAALPGWDQDASDDLTTGTVFAGDVGGTYGALVIGTGVVKDANITGMAWSKLQGMPAGFADGIDDTATTLQEAYAGGNTLTATSAGGALTFDSSESGAFNTLTLNKSGPAGGTASAAALRINMNNPIGTSGTVTGIDVDFGAVFNTGTARGINVRMNHTYFDAIYTNAQITAGSFHGDGSALTAVDADTVDGVHASGFAGVSHSHSTLTAGSGLAGGPYDGTGAATFAVTYGSTSGTAVAGDQTATITAGTGLSGGVALDALGDGFSATLKVNTGSGIQVSADQVTLGPLTANWSQTGAYDLVLDNASSELRILESNGGTYYGILDVADLSADQTFVFSAGGTVWTSGMDGAGSGLDADLLDGQQGSYYLDWNSLTNVPAGFADNTDDGAEPIIQRQDGTTQFTLTPANSALRFTGGGMTDVSFDATTHEVAISTALPNDHAPSYTYKAALDYSGTVGSYSSIGVLESGMPIVSYRDAANGDLKVTVCGDIQCSSSKATTVVVDSTGDVGSFSSLTLDGSGKPIISYYDASNGDLKIARCTNCKSGTTYDNWTTRVVDSTGDVGQYSSITSVNGYAAISYYDVTNKRLKYTHCTNWYCTSVTTRVVDNSSTDVGKYTSIGARVTGGLIISYYDAANGYLKAAKCSGSSCSTPYQYTLDTNSDTGLFTSLTIGDDGRPLISYFRNSTYGAVKVASCDDSSCSTATLHTIHAGSFLPIRMYGQHTSITIGRGGFPVVAYQEYSTLTNRSLWFAKCGAFDCSSVATTVKVDYTGSCGYYTSITTGMDGLPIISHFDSSGGDLRVAKCKNSFCLSNWSRR